MCRRGIGQDTCGCVRGQGIASIKKGLGDEGNIRAANTLTRVPLAQGKGRLPPSSLQQRNGDRGAHCMRGPTPVLLWRFPSYLILVGRKRARGPITDARESNSSKSGK